MIPIEHLIILVLSNKTRLDIVDLLAGGPKTLKQIAASLSLDQSSLRYHLKVLQGVGFVGRSSILGGRGRPKASYHMAIGLPSLTVAQNAFLESRKVPLTSFLAQAKEAREGVAPSASAVTTQWPKMNRRNGLRAYPVATMGPNSA